MSALVVVIGKYAALDL